MAVSISPTGFKMKPLVGSQYGLGDTKNPERGQDTSFFVEAAVKPFLETRLRLSDSQSTELAATRGSCGNHEEIA